jgi:hypothetical protein
MGELIRRTASADDIIADVRGTLTSAVARGGAWQELAEEQLSSVVRQPSPRLISAGTPARIAAQ